MVGVHPHPAEALTDAAQQITPQALADVIAHWATTPYPTSVAEAARALEPLRSKIDDIDHDLISLLTQRMAVSKRIASVKRDAHMPVYQQARWSDMMNDRLRQATSLGLDADFMKELLEKIHAASVRVQLENGK
jgi:chorismate mutase